jgi:competence protein ComEA
MAGRRRPRTAPADRHNPSTAPVDPGDPLATAGGPLGSATAPADLVRVPTTPAGRLVERWVPGGVRAADRIRDVLRRHPVRVAVAALAAVATAIGTAVALATSTPAVEAAPALPAAVSITSSSSAPPATPSSIVVSVVGRVGTPGLVSLPDGARVLDAVRAAGGAATGTDLTSLNLAQRLADGEQIYVGIPVPAQTGPDPAAAGTTDGTGVTGGNPGVSGAPATSGGDGGVSAKKGSKAALAAAGGVGKVDLNSATADQLQTLPGVGPATAQKIIAYRVQHGNFRSVDQLQDISGIGDGKYAKLKDLVTV